MSDCDPKVPVSDDNGMTQTNDEIEIQIDDEHLDKKIDDTSSETKQETKLVENKSIKSLADDERAIIIANAKSGIEQPNFDVKFFSNGNFRIIKRKQVKPSVSQKVINADNENTLDKQIQDKKIYYTNDQLLIEHTIELNSKVDKLMSTHKKLKRKYQTLCTDLYVDDNDNDNINENNTSHDYHKQTISQNEINNNNSNDDYIPKTQTPQINRCNIMNTINM
ncbi:hypothetical protein M9Y10_024136 [Tritrichomonas musculus]|uniref:Uncharacterized protein n=1 Tax=Tritrichomonas musculus TaxID=1915356 RepID=A0ABR2KY68_9EUKA